MKIYNRTQGKELGEVRTADHFIARLKGLLFDDPEKTSRALWIVPCNGIHTLGMRHPLDIVFLSRDFKVLKIARDIKPGSWGPFCNQAHSVLEFFSERSCVAQIALGDQLEIL